MLDYKSEHIIQHDLQLSLFVQNKMIKEDVLLVGPGGMRIREILATNVELAIKRMREQSNAHVAYVAF